ncbi:maleylpyruvate isomerase family mycothiol-dependent enzyme [Streptomyces sp. NPDC059009]|uniref:maleylpyruvate isomerase family mycothiol-dependent enzyme n=1 Tax=Streptomyces sp. NPDC059009 TaxID=3346694 RepID=UPI00368DFBE7
MKHLSHDRYCSEIVTQTELLRAHIKGADPAAPVPTVPGWTLAHLLRHLGGAHRWTETIVRTRATGPVAHDQIDDPSVYADVDAAALGAWLGEGAEQLADALREAGPDVAVWTVAPGGTPLFWARRMTYETLVHRADAASAVGAEYVVEDEVGVDAVEEWLGFSALPQAYASEEARTALRAPGRTLRLYATDTSPEAPADWLVDLSADPFTWRRTTEQDRDGTATPTATVHGPLADLVLLLYGRRTPDSETLTAHGDAGVLTDWLHEASAWLRR